MSCFEGLSLQSESFPNELESAQVHRLLATTSLGPSESYPESRTLESFSTESGVFREVPPSGAGIPSLWQGRFTAVIGKNAIFQPECIQKLVPWEVSGRARFDRVQSRGPELSWGIGALCASMRKKGLGGSDAYDYHHGGRRDQSTAR